VYQQPKTDYTQTRN